MKIKYLGHASFLMEDLLIDPYLKDNPRGNIDPKSIRCSIVCVTHDHFDHLGDAFQIAKDNDAVVIAIHEVAVMAEKEGIKAEGMNIGGHIEAGDWSIKMVNAVHSSNRGSPAGFILKNKKSGSTIYHAGDTGLFGDMKLIGDEGIDIAMLPIGDRYTMGIDDALKAVEMIRPKVVIPMHYNTFPIIPADPEEFRKRSPVKVEVFKYGEEKDL